jgi:hypothetical protein
MKVLQDAAGGVELESKLGPFKPKRAASEVTVHSESQLDIRGAELGRLLKVGPKFRELC